MVVSHRTITPTPAVIEGQETRAAVKGADIHLAVVVTTTKVPVREAALILITPALAVVRTGDLAL